MRILFLMFMLVIASDLIVFAQNYSKDGIRIVESSVVERKFTVSDIEKNLAEAQRNVNFWQSEVLKWQAMKNKTVELSVDLPVVSGVVTFSGVATSEEMVNP